MKPVIIDNDKNRASLTKFIGKQMNLNKLMLNILKQVNNGGDTFWSAADEFERLVKEQDTIEWDVR